MKQRILILLFAIMLPLMGWSQSFEHFLGKGAAQVLAEMAHPFNTYDSYAYEVNSKGALVLLNYQEGYKTLVQLHCNGYFITRVEVIRDTDWATPFLAVDVIKRVLLKSMESSDNETLQQACAMIGKQIGDMNGRELAAMVLTIRWLNQ